MEHLAQHIVEEFIGKTLENFSNILVWMGFDVPVGAFGIFSVLSLVAGGLFWYRGIRLEELQKEEELQKVAPTTDREWSDAEKEAFRRYALRVDFPSTDNSES